MDIPQVTVPATALGWVTIGLSILAACAVAAYAIYTMLDPRVAGARKKRLGAVLALVMSWLILEVRWLVKPIIFEYDDTYWAVWEMAVFAYFLIAIRQHTEETATHALEPKPKTPPPPPPPVLPPTSPPGAQPPV